METMKPHDDHPLPESRCLGCGDLLDRAMTTAGENTPGPGDITVCLHCGHIMAFAEDLTLRALTDAEMRAVAGDPRVVRANRLRAAVWDKRPRLGDMTLAELARYSGLTKDAIIERLLALQTGEPRRVPTEDEIWQALGRKP